ncbi:MAG: hypothetical protein ABJM11_19715 [Marinobacter sp.]|uniref:hypothetical protein n=1 Tax=Marinobacter sp. TaxID=50741 RepID=UPI0032968BBC
MLFLAMPTPALREVLPLSKRITTPAFFTWFIRVMAVLLFYVAASIAYEFVYLPLGGSNS